MAKYWLVEVHYPLDDFSLEDQLEAMIGKQRSGSGAGFGKRDIDWTFNEEEEARTVARKLLTYAVENPHYQMAVQVTEHDDEE